MTNKNKNDMWKNKVTLYNVQDSNLSHYIYLLKSVVDATLLLDQSETALLCLPEESWLVVPWRA